MSIRTLSTKKDSLFFSFILLIYSLLRLPSVIEPYWYGDEGIYEVIGLALTKGRILYAQIWDNKPPLLYVFYSLVHADQFMIRLLSLLFGFAAIVVFFLLTKRLFANNKIVLLATSLFALLFATPATESNIANAENFMLFFIIGAGYLLFTSADKANTSLHALFHNKKNLMKILCSGILLGIAFLFKIVALFDFAAFSVFILILIMRQKIDKKQIISFVKIYSIFLIGFLLPSLITASYFLTHNAFSSFLTATFFSNVSYVGYKNYFIIPQGLLILKLFLLCVAIMVVFKKREHLTLPEIFITSWFSFSVFNVFFSQRPYTHYVLVGIASLALITALIISDRQKYRLLAIGVGIILAIVFSTFYPFPKVLPYYNNYLSFITNHKSLASYESYFDSDVLRDNDIASYLKLHNARQEGVFLWGNSAQIYVLSDTLPPGKYTVAYHINDTSAIMETQKAIDMKKPKFIILLPDSQHVPLSLYNYTYKLTLGNASVYERVH